MLVETAGYVLIIFGAFVIVITFATSTINYIKATLAYRAGNFTRGNFHSFNQLMGSVLFLASYLVFMSYTFGFSHNSKLFIVTWLVWTVVSAALLQLQKRLVVVEVKNKFYALPIKINQ